MLYKKESLLLWRRSNNLKRAVILHGTDNNPSELWFPWLRKELERLGYEVFAPTLPQNHTPNRHIYDKFLRESGWDYSDNLLVGHSSGATTILNLLTSGWFPRVKTTVLVGTFLNEKLSKNASWYETGQFDNLFKEHYDPKTLKNKGGAFYFVHGSDDPYCDINDAKQLCNSVNGKFITVPNGGHLAQSSGIKELPQIIENLEHDNLL